MKPTTYRNKGLPAWRLHRAFIPLLLLVTMMGLVAAVAWASEPLDVAGYWDYTYGDVVINEPTADSAESKLWWNDGRWWGILWNPTEEAYHIYWLNRTNHEWVDTGTAVDDRPESRSDVLWDGNRLYVASHYKRANPVLTRTDAEWARLYRFNYNASSKVYTLIPGPEGRDYSWLNAHMTNALVIDKDQTGRLWATWVSSKQGEDASLPYKWVYVSYSDDDGATWALMADEDFTLDQVGIAENRVKSTVDAAASLLVFGQGEAQQVGVMWSNQYSPTNPLKSSFYVAFHPVSSMPDEDWEVDLSFNDAFPLPGDDHISLKRSPNNEFLAAVKTESTDPFDPLVAVIGRTQAGTYITDTVSEVRTEDTRPLLVVDGSADEAYVFVSSRAGGGQICYSTSPISPLSAMSFPANRNCDPPPAALVPGGIQFPMPVAIGDADCNLINNTTSTKQVVNAQSDIAILATDDSRDPDRADYFHNVIEVGPNAPQAPLGPEGNGASSPCVGMAENALYLPSLMKQ